MVMQPRAVGRFKKLEVIYFVFCLCMQFIGDVSTAYSFSKKIESSSEVGDTIKGKSSLSNDLKSSENGSKHLTRKSRATSELDLISIYADGGSELGAIRKSLNLNHKNSNTYLEQKQNDLNYSHKRNKGSSLIPFPRIGRSKVDPNLIMPYPDSWLMPYQFKTQTFGENNLEEFSDAYKPTFDDEEEFQSSVSKLLSVEEDDEDSIIEDDAISPDINEIEIESIADNLANGNVSDMPFSRLGKRDVSLSKMVGIQTNQNPSAKVKRTSESLIPQIRYGRSVKPQKISKQVKTSLYVLPNYRPGRSMRGLENYLRQDKTKQSILPYPRPGRSNINENIKRQTYILPQPRFGRSAYESKSLEKAAVDMFLQINPSLNDKLSEEILKTGDTMISLIPYPRPGKRFFGTKPLPPNVNLQIKEKENSPVDDDKDIEPATATFLVPYPRPGRADNNKQIYIPKKENGKSVPNSMIPNARFGKAIKDSMLPYPRFGRSSSNTIMLPYPRPGRSVSLIPHARFGKSNILPYPRLERSVSSFLAHPRLKRAYDTVLPYPRLGRSSVIVYPRPGRAFESVLPNVRFGRRSIIPQIRVGKSTFSDPVIFDFTEDSNDILIPDQSKDSDLDLTEEKELEDLNGKSETNSSNNNPKSVLIPAKKLQKHMLTHESNYMLPYPRPGRFV